MVVSSVRFYESVLIRLWLTAGLMLGTLIANPSRLVSDSLAAPPPQTPAPELDRLSLSFVPNAGQTDPAVRFQTHSLGGALFFTANEVVLALPSAQPELRPADLRLDLPTELLQNRSSVAAAPPDVVRLRFVGANAAPEVTGLERLPGIVNYFLGNDPAKWRSNLPTYGSIVYRNLYPGIDLHYNGTEGQLKGTYRIAPGADPSRIRWRYDGAATTQVDATSGALRVTLPRAGQANAAQASSQPLEILELAPLSWQDINGQRVLVDTRYVLNSDGSIGFALPKGYDRTQPLTLDPTLIYSSYLGGFDEDNANAIALDASGNIYVTGLTASTNFPTQDPQQGTNAGGFDAFVTKLNAAGSALLYSTYLGGIGANDYGQSLAVDNSGNAYIAGLTDSTDFPTAGTPYQATNGGVYDAFVTKLNSAGSTLLYSTYLGGSDLDWSLGIAVDATAGNAYVTGRAGSADFPTAGLPYQSIFGGGASDAFVARINTTLTGTASLPYASYIGGSGEDRGSSISADAATGAAYLTGRTGSTNFPIAGAPYQSTFGGGAFDAFVLQLNTTLTGTASLIYSSYLGGNGDDRGFALTRDSANNVYLTGRTVSANFPTTSGVFQAALSSGTCLDASSNPVPCPDTFVAKVNPAAAGSASLIYVTYLGGNDYEEAFGIAVDSSTGNAFVTGYTNSPDFPTQNALQPVCGWNCGLDFVPPNQIGFVDAFVTKLNPTGSALLFSSYLGGSSADLAFGIARNFSTGDIYLTGETLSTDFPTLNPFQNFRAGNYDVFVVRVGDTLTSADLSITKTDTPDPVAAGGTLTYTLTIRNSGPDPATGVKLVDSLPGGGSVFYNNATASQGNCALANSQTVSCNLGDLANSATATATILVNVSTFAPALITNTASVASNISDPVGANNVATQTTTVNFEADLEVTKTDTPDPVQVGRPLTYTLTVTNNSFLVATTTRLTDTLPASVTFGSATPSQGSCSGSSIIACDLGDLFNGSPASVTIVVTPTSTGTITNTVTVTSTISDPNLANNTDTESTTVTSPSANLAITKSDSPDPAQVGNPLTYTLVVTNAGPLTATGTTLTDTLPAGVVFRSVSSSQGSCGGVNVITCALGTLSSNTIATVTIMVTPTLTGIITNTVSVTSTIPDPVAINNTTSQSTTVIIGLPTYLPVIWRSTP